MDFFGSFTVIKRSGENGHVIPMTSEDILIGRGSDCDIRVYLETVSRKHCHIKVNENSQSLFTNLSYDLQSGTNDVESKSHGLE